MNCIIPSNSELLQENFHAGLFSPTESPKESEIKIKKIKKPLEISYTWRN
jgi:hypothetical protein